jgi:UDP-N-acetylbacillosamine N-acetyltransferase
MKELYVFGSGGHGAVVAEIADLLGYVIVGFLDDDASRTGTKVLNWSVLGGREAAPDGATVALGIGSNAVRAEIASYARTRGWETPTLAHPSAVISPSVELGPGTVVMALVAVNAHARVGRGCILNTSSSIDHDCVLGDFTHIAPGANLAGSVTVGEQSLIGVGSCVLPRVNIGSNCVIGAGSVVVSDCRDGITAFGNPARARAH